MEPRPYEWTDEKARTGVDAYGTKMASGLLPLSTRPQSMNHAWKAGSQLVETSAETIVS